MAHYTLGPIPRAGGCATVARVALKRVDDGLGAPWDRPLQGALDELVVDSELLADNPLGDSPRRPLLVYQAPGAGDAGGVPSVYVIQGYGGQAREWLNRDSFDPSPIDRPWASVVALGCFSSGVMGGS